MNEEQMCKEFEELVVGMKDAQGMSYSLYSENGVYVFKNTHDLWTGFKMAREIDYIVANAQCNDYELKS